MKSFVYSTCACAVLALVVGCGGGGGGGGTSVPDPQPNPAPTPDVPVEPILKNAPSSDCFNAVLTTAETQYQLNYIAVNAAGETVDTRRVSGKVTGNQTFFWDNSGNIDPGLIEIEENLRWGAEPFPNVSKRYVLVSGQRVTQYGSIDLTSSSINNFQVDRTDRKKWMPSVVDGRFVLAKDKSDIWSWAESISTENFSWQNQETEYTSPDAPIPRSIKFTYLGQETIDIPAGKFTACKFSKEMANQTTYEWLGKGNGVLLQFSGKTDEEVEYVAKLQADSRLNGKPF